MSAPFARALVRPALWFSFTTAALAGGLWWAVTPPPHAPIALPHDASGEWLALSNHNHSSIKEGLKPIATLEREAVASGLDALAITDHDTAEGCATPAFLHPPGRLIMVRGMEWSVPPESPDGSGHLGLLGIAWDCRLQPGDTVADSIAEARTRRALILINHPFTFGRNWTAGTIPPGVDGVEVWNGWWWLAAPLIRNRAALDWWDAGLRQGRQLLAVAGTDDHGHVYGAVDRNVCWVLAPRRTEAGVLAGLRAGHVTLGAAVDGPRVFLEAVGPHGEIVRMGDRCPEPPSSTLMVHLRVQGARGLVLRLMTRRGEVASLPVTQNDATLEQSVTLERPFDFVRAEVRPHLAGFALQALSNPIYVGAAPP